MSARRAGPSATRQAGLSLVELMIVLVIGMVLTAGLLQVFAASRTAYQVAQGFGRVQENARFAIDFLQRDLRMVGHMGCVNDQARMLSKTAGFSNRFAAGNPVLAFTTGIQGYEASATGPGGSLGIAADPVAGTWSGSPLPDYISRLEPLPNSDIVVLRFFSPEGIPVQGFSAGSSSATIQVDPDRWKKVIVSDGYETPGLLGIADCLNANTFQASEFDALSGTITVTGSKGLNSSAGLSDGIYVAGQTMLYRAESEVFYVGLNRAGSPSLYRVRFTADLGGALALVGGGPEELVEGIENMQILYGMDNQKDLRKAPSGFIASQGTADAVAGCTDNPDNPDLDCWNRVGLVRLAILSRSTERASSTVPIADRDLLGTRLTPLPDDGRYRVIYGSTIALRNRLYGN